MVPGFSKPAGTVAGLSHVTATEYRGSECVPEVLRRAGDGFAARGFPCAVFGSLAVVPVSFHRTQPGNGSSHGAGGSVACLY